MVRTKKHFRPPSSDSSSESSSEEEDASRVITGRGKQLGNFGRGKQLGAMGGGAMTGVPPGGRGKQLRAAEPESEEESSDESSSSEEEEEEEVPSPSRGKQLRPMGRGKQLRAPSPPPPAAAAQKDNNETDSSTSAYQPPPGGIVRGGGKQFSGGMGKQLPRPTQPPVEEEDSDSSSDEEPWNQPPQRGMGKQLPRPPPAAAAKEESDMEESSEEEEEEAVVKKPAPKAKAKAKPQPKKKKQPELDDEESDEESDFEPEEETKKKKPAPKRRGRPPARAAATRATQSAKATAKKEISSAEEDEEEEEEEESEDVSSDESSDEEQEWDMETFDTQKLVQGADDKKYLDSLPEIERESILAERFEKLKADADMKKALKENKRREREKKKSAGAQKKKPTRKRAAPAKAKKAAPPKKKRTVTKKKKVESESEEEDEDMDDTMGDEALAKSLAGKRVSARNLAKKGKQFKKQAALAKIRANRANKQAAVEEESDSDLDYGRDSDDSDDDYEESVKPWQQKGKKKPLPESSDDESMGVEDEQQAPAGSIQKQRTEDIEAELEDYHKVSIPRRRLIRWCNEPFFGKAVKNFYVRLNIGRDNKTQKPCYRLCKILAVVTKTEYSFPVDNQRPVTTDKWLQLAFGSSVRDFKMLTISDHRPSQDDVTQLVNVLRTERKSDEILTKKRANKLRKRQDELVNNYTYTKDDIDMLVKEKKKRSKKSLNIGLEKTRIALAVQAAKDEVEEAKRRVEEAEVEAAAEANSDMTDLVEDNVKKAKEALETAEKKLEENIEEQKRIQQEDQERTNRLKQSSKVQNWVKVNQRAKLANRNADFEAFKEEQARKKMQGAAEPKFDPYARRRQKPKNLWEVGGPNKQSDKEVVEEEKKETTERDDANVGKEVGGENKREEIPEPQKLVIPGQANKFVFDDDIAIGDINLGGIGSKKVRTRTRKGLSLDDYQARKTDGTL